MSYRLTESVSLNGSQIDTAAGVIRGVKLLGRTSVNGRDYSDNALAQAAKLYEGIDVNIDHPDKSTPHADRKVCDRFGQIENATIKPDGVYGDFHYLKSHPMSGMLVEAAQRMPGKVGFSHNSEGKLTKKNGKWVVESIASVRSVDLVANPATTNGLFESRNKTMTLREIFAGCKNTRLTALLEDDDMSAMGDMPVDTAGESGSDAQMKAAFCAALAAVLDESDKAAAASKAKKLINAYFGIVDDESGSTPSEEPAMTAEESAKAKKNPTLAQLQEQVNQYAAREEVRKLASEAKVELSDLNLKAATMLESAERKAFIEGLAKAPAKGLPATSAPRFSLFESAEAKPGPVPTDHKKFAAMCR